MAVGSEMDDLEQHENIPKEGGGNWRGGRVVGDRYQLLFSCTRRGKLQNLGHQKIPQKFPGFNKKIMGFN
jgi:hypothetical protein